MTRIVSVPDVAHSSVLEQSKHIMDLIAELRHAQQSLACGPEILMLVNELAISCETLFEDRERLLVEASDREFALIRDMHAEFLISFADFADQIRANNGELDEAFFNLLAEGPIRTFRFAA